MARQNHGPLSRAKGKLGGVVYQQYEGMQISREYQPVVKNPQTNKQTANRAKFKLSSQIVAQFKEVISSRLSPLSIYERMRRAAAVNAIYGIVDDGTPSNPDALITSVVSAINAKSVSAILAPILKASTNELNIEMDAGFTVLYKLCAYDKTKGELIGSLSESYTASAEPKAVNLMDNARNVVMAVAFRSRTEAGRATISNITSNENGWQNEISRGVAAGDIEVSSMSGVIVTTN